VAAPSVGQHTATKLSSSASSLTTPTGLTTTPGSCFLVGVISFDSRTVSSITDSPDGTFTDTGNTYAPIQSPVQYTNDTTGRVSLFKCEGGTGGAAHKWRTNLSGATPACTMFVIECTGSGVVVDVAPAGLYDNTTPYSSNASGTTSVADTLLIAVVGTYTTSAGTDVIDGSASSFTLLDAQTDPNDVTGGTLQRTVSSTGSYTLSFTSAGATTTAAISFIVALKNTGGGGGGSLPTRKALLGVGL